MVEFRLFESKDFVNGENVGTSLNTGSDPEYSVAINALRIIIILSCYTKPQHILQAK